jgi:hypothetical protein
VRSFFWHPGFAHTVHQALVLFSGRQDYRSKLTRVICRDNALIQDSPKPGPFDIIEELGDVTEFPSQRK